MSTRVSPRGNWVLVKPERRPTEAGGIYLSVTTAGNTGIVLDSGAPMELHVGDRVLFDGGLARGAGIENPGLLLVKAEDIRAVLETEGEN